jgi:hypothetical protein
MLNAIHPQEYAAHLARKRNEFVSLVKGLGVIREKDPGVYERLRGKIKERANAWM